MDEELSELESGAVLREHILDMMNVCYRDLLGQSALGGEQQQATASSGAEWSPDTTLQPAPPEGSANLRRSLYDNATVNDLLRLAQKQGDSAATQSKSGESMDTDRWRSLLKTAARPLFLATIVLVVAIVIAFTYAITTGARVDRSRTKQSLARSLNGTDDSVG
ncbi:uncharacterized protein LOC119401860 [Rhipicephalus sanguineus]|uniref:uncharacterized protein LOC119401860 n=1 Tax=Rhipicephalus sanguineus TaxID=34632 RepID=UPI0018946CDF|nr:uncharacterized protein LOC119401860 [Rhipicephalus sanguineus]